MLQQLDRVAFCLLLIYFHAFGFSLISSTSSQLSLSASLPGLQPGWLWGKHVDLSDVQWRQFRASSPALAVALLAFVLVSQLARLFWARASTAVSLLLSFAFLVALHGVNSLYVVALLCANYTFCKTMPRFKYSLLCLWVAHIAAFLVIRASYGSPLQFIHPRLQLPGLFSGMLRWHIHYNFMMLRMLSFSCDLQWARGNIPPRFQMTSSKQAVQDARMRVEKHQPLQLYSFSLYCLYCLYPPLYIAGPIITYNSFISHLVTPPPRNWSQTLVYAVRWLVAWLALEILTHTLYVNCLAKHRVLQWAATHGLLQSQPVHYALTGYFVLVFMWLKFLVIWRFFRFFAMLDNVVPPENMLRCVCNNYDIEGFWKHWHASYNQWLVRYIYIPLGGSRWRLFNVWVIFTFVALWHDLELRLLGWAWIMALAMAPELAVKAIARTETVRKFAHTAGYCYLAAAAASVNILILMVGNMVGFVLGTDGIVPFLQQALGKPSFVALVFLAFFSAAQVMFWIRELKSAAPKLAASCNSGAESSSSSSSHGKAIKGMLGPS